MQWKLARGKWRPLQKLVATNNAETVEKVSAKAFAKLPNIKLANKELCALRAIGPATASAVLVTICTDAPFMADEAMEAVPGLGERNYTLPHYLEFASALQERARELGDGWTPELVGRALWSEAKYSILADVQGKGAAAKKSKSKSKAAQGEQGKESPKQENKRPAETNRLINAEPKKRTRLRSGRPMSTV